MSAPLHIVAVGGTLRAGSSTERALRAVLASAERRGASVAIVTGDDLDMPSYAPEKPERSAAAARLVEELRRADAVIVGSPGYHGGISGLVKNALDHIEDMRGDARCYLDGLPVGCVATGAGWQGAVATLGQIRCVVHALRGWPTPLGIAINTAGGGGDPVAADPVPAQIEMMIDQIWAFHRR